MKSIATLAIALTIPAAGAISPAAGVSIAQVRISPAAPVVSAIQPTEVSVRIWTTGAKAVTIEPAPPGGHPDGAEPDRIRAEPRGESGGLQIWEAVFELNRNSTPGQWSARLAASDGDEATARKEPPFTVRRHTDLKDFNVAPDEVPRGGKVTVSGELRRLDPFALNTSFYVPYANQRIKVLHRAQGAKRFRELGTIATTSSGRFSKTFRARQDGTWRAEYPGSATQAPHRSSDDHVDVH